MKRWLYVILGLIINITLGTVYSWSVFRKPLENPAALGLSPTESGLPYMIFLAAFAFSMPFAGFFIERLGPRITVITGGIFVGFGWAASSFASSIGMIIVTYGLIAGIGVGITYGVPLAVSAKWFPDKKGLALGLTLAGFGLSPFVTAPLARYLIESQGLMPTFRILGIAFLAIIVLLSLPLRFPDDRDIRARSATAGIKEARKAKQDIQMTPKQMFGTRQFYGLWICFTIGTLAGLTAIGITSPFAQEVAGLSAVSAAFAASIFGIFNGIGRPIFGSMTDNLGPKVTAFISFGLIILASITALMAEGSAILFYISFAVVWLNLGGWLAIAPAGTSSFFGLKNYSKNYGFMYTAYGVGALLGIPLSGWLKESMGSYTSTFLPVIVLSIVGIIVAAATLKRPEQD